MATQILSFNILALLRKRVAEHMAGSLDSPDTSWVFDQRNHGTYQTSTEQSLDTVGSG